MWRGGVAGMPMSMAETSRGVLRDGTGPNRYSGDGKQIISAPTFDKSTVRVKTRQGGVGEAVVSKPNNFARLASIKNPVFLPELKPSGVLKKGLQRPPVQDLTACWKMKSKRRANSRVKTERRKGRAKIVLKMESGPEKGLKRSVPSDESHPDPWANRKRKKFRPVQPLFFDGGRAEMPESSSLKPKMHYTKVAKATCSVCGNGDAIKLGDHDEITIRKMYRCLDCAYEYY